MNQVSVRNSFLKKSATEFPGQYSPREALMHMKVNNVIHSWIHIVNSYKKCQLSSLRLEGATRASTDASSVESRLD
jgi:hypothetical protein